MVIPIEVKSKKGTSLKSIRILLETHKSSPYGIRFSTHDYSIHDQVHSFPLYSVVTIQPAERNSLLALIKGKRG